jgi:hypothetical protein
MSRMPKTSKKAPKSSAPRLNKSAWIRSQPASMPAKDVVAKGKAEHVSLSLAQVYTARSNAKKKGEPKGKPGRKPNAVARLNGGGGSEELAFRRIVLAVGITKAETMLEALKHSVGL